MTKSPVEIGQHVTFTVSIKNDGPDTAHSVSLSDTHDASLNTVSMTPPTGGSCTESGSIACSLPDIPSGASRP